MRKYADPADWDDSDFTDGPVPAGVSKLLARASQTVDGLLLTAVYDTDDDGYPTAPATVEALRDATLAQASYWVETGDSTGASDAAGGSMSIGSVSLGASRLPVTTRTERARNLVAPMAEQILANAGLISRIVRGR